MRGLKWVKKFNKTPGTSGGKSGERGKRFFGGEPDEPVYELLCWDLPGYQRGRREG